eukprot:1405366-Pleurochrysis_carterae.AAC.1
MTGRAASAGKEASCLRIRHACPRNRQASLLRHFRVKVGRVLRMRPLVARACSSESGNRNQKGLSVSQV